MGAFGFGTKLRREVEIIKKCLFWSFQFAVEVSMKYESIENYQQC